MQTIIVDSDRFLELLKHLYEQFNIKSVSTHLLKRFGIPSDATVIESIKKSIQELQILEKQQTGFLEWITYYPNKELVNIICTKAEEIAIEIEKEKSIAQLSKKRRRNRLKVVA